MMDLSLQIAGILGPILMALASSEYLNYRIWEQVEPTLVYLNGLFLFSGGMEWFFWSLPYFFDRRFTFYHGLCDPSLTVLQREDRSKKNGQYMPEYSRPCLFCRAFSYLD